VGGKKWGREELLRHMLTRAFVLYTSLSSILFNPASSSSVIVFRRPSGVGIVIDNESVLETTFKGAVAITLTNWSLVSVTVYYISGCYVLVNYTCLQLQRRIKPLGVEKKANELLSLPPFLFRLNPHVSYIQAKDRLV
jgi:hypothetical protein